ncbi:MAG: DNA-protecting protein DprA [Ruminococcaceae bacterium]|nr:DNA-protecting protein DprA [Oscillospiraceae bacterium]
MNKKLYWIWISLALGPGSSCLQKLLSAFDNSVEEIYKADRSDYKKSKVKLTDKRISALSNKSLEDAELIYDWCENNNVGILCYDDEKYPKRLAAIPDAPAVLYYIGKLYDIDSMLCIAGVGTRSMTKYGHDTAYTFCYDLAKSGAIIVSGMALGIDTACHRGALDSGGRTITVLGCPINRAYPYENRSLMVEIARNGLILTEYPVFFETRRSCFPQRNRIISGLCQGTIVFEADVGSGALITASHAVKQGRQVYALPGKIGEENSLGTNELIKNGARIITNAGDIIDEFGYLYPKQISSHRVYDYSPASKVYDSFLERKASHKAKKAEPPKSEETEPQPLDTAGLTETEAKIYNEMTFGKAVSTEELIFDNIPFADVISSLTMLEIKGYIEPAPGGKYYKTGLRNK